jgi:hypothetical protein
MKITLTEWEVADHLKRDDNAGWSYEGAKALSEYLCNLDEELGEDTELDVVAIRCDFSEYKTATEAALQYGWDDFKEDDHEDYKEVRALTWLQDRTQAIEFEGGIIIQDF